MRGSLVLTVMVVAGAMIACGSADDSRDPSGLTAIAPAPPDASSCRSAQEASQRHGTACLCCHSDEFGVAGSVDPAGPPLARVVVTGTDGDVADMAVNPFANFFRHFPLATPVRAVVYAPDGRSVAMRELAPSADCNACHWTGGTAGPIVGP